MFYLSKAVVSCGLPASQPTCLRLSFLVWRQWPIAADPRRAATKNGEEQCGEWPEQPNTQGHSLALVFAFVQGAAILKKGGVSAERTIGIERRKARTVWDTAFVYHVRFETTHLPSSMFRVLRSVLPSDMLSDGWLLARNQMYLLETGLQ